MRTDDPPLRIVTTKKSAVLFTLAGISLLVTACGPIISTITQGVLVAGSSGPAESIPDRIERQCKEQFGPYEQAVMDCRMRLTVKYLSEGQQEKMDRAYRGVR